LLLSKLVKTGEAVTLRSLLSNAVRLACQAEDDTGGKQTAKILQLLIEGGAAIDNDAGYVSGRTFPKLLFF
jgi:hypothetical protein